MKEKIQNLLDEYRLLKQEANSLLEELSKMDISKMSPEDIIFLEETKKRVIEETVWRGVFIGRLEDILTN